VAAGAVGVELVLRDVVPGHTALSRITGACDVPAAAPSLSPGATSRSGQFFSKARNRTVHFTVAYPPGSAPGQPLGLAVVLHGFGRDHGHAFSGLSLADAAALQVDGRPPARMALLAADGATATGTRNRATTRWACWSTS
jgi:hypothetical protein